MNKEKSIKKSHSLKIGQTAAIAIAIETAVFAFSLILGLIFHSSFDKNLSYIASIFLAASVVVMMACFHDSTQGQSKLFSLLALGAAVIYAPFCMSVYFLQLSIVATNPLNLSSEVLKAIEFTPGSPTFAIDMLGYGFLCLSTLAAGFALTEAKDKALRGLCFMHGALAPFTFSAPIISGLFQSAGGGANDAGNYVLLFWCTIFIPIALLFMRHFKEKQEV